MNKTTVLLLGLILAGCMSSKAAVEKPPDVVPVFYATDRMPTDEATPQAMFGAERGPLSFGIADVSFPEDHRTGQIESPSLWSIEFTADPARHVVDKNATPASWVGFLGALQQKIAESPDRSAFVFVHGYNVGFADATRRVAQIAHDLNWEGAAILFSWPSRGGLAGYWSDADNAQWAADDLAKLLTEVASRSGAETLHLIAHSVGTEPTLAALTRLSGQRRADGRPLFDEVVLAAPDVDAQAFSEQLLQARPVAERWTVYVSGRDEALRLSSRLHDQPRAGYSADGVVVIPGVDTIDASAVDVSLIGHSYYGENRSVLADIFNLLKTRLPPDKRFGLRQVAQGDRRYWVFQP
jgi:esterase/lipase superfamily enzyme